MVINAHTYRDYRPNTS